MKIDDFVQKSGLKILAMAKLKKSEYSIVLYLLNCVASGLDSIITTGTVTDAYDMKKGLSFSINVDKFDLATHTLNL